ncbi:MAG: Crp/Fnr family transcriptional regulator [Planctomycetota bacterium]
MSDLDLALSRTALFADLGSEVRQRLLATSTIEYVSAGTRLLAQGDCCPGVIVVLTGGLRVYKLSPCGKEHLLRLVEPGGSLLEVPVLTNQVAPAHITAFAPTRYLQTNATTFRSLIAEDHAACLRLLGTLGERVTQLSGLIEDLVLRDATARVAHFLLGNSDVVTGRVRLPVARREIACHLNLSPETLSRSLRRLRDMGAVDDQRHNLIIADRVVLDRIAEGQEQAVA